MIVIIMIMVQQLGLREKETLRITYMVINEPTHEKTNKFGFRPGPTQTSLCNQGNKLEDGNFEYK